MIKAYVSDFLLDYDCPIEYSGFNVLCEILCESCENYSQIQTNLKSIYLVVAAKMKITRLSIERNLRTLIQVWSVKPKFKELFTEHPTNARLIITLTHKLCHLQKSVYDTLLIS